MTHFYVYAITFDQDTFGIFSTREAAEQDLARQIAEGGPAWDACKVERWRVEGEPEVVSGQEEPTDGAASDPRPDPRTHPEYWTE